LVPEITAQLVWLIYMGPCTRWVSLSELIIRLRPFFEVTCRLQPALLEFVPQLLSLAIAGKVLNAGDMSRYAIPVSEYGKFMRRWGLPPAYCIISARCIVRMGVAFTHSFNPT